MQARTLPVLALLSTLALAPLAAGAQPRGGPRATCPAAPATGGLRVELVSFEGRPGHGRLRVVNGTGATVRVWRTASSWGDLPVTFEAHAGGRTIHVRWNGAYTRNVAAPVDVPAGCAYEIAFDFADRDWTADEPFARWVGPGATLAVVYDVPADADAAREHVVTGRLVSAPVAWRP